LQEAKPQCGSTILVKPQPKGPYPVLSSPGGFVFCPHDSRYPSDTRYHKQNNKTKAKIMKHIMLLGAGIVCKVKPKGTGFTGMKAVQGRAKCGPESDKALPLRALHCIKSDTLGITCKKNILKNNSWCFKD
jgi:hypothetical protein